MSAKTTNPDDGRPADDANVAIPKFDGTAKQNEWALHSWKRMLETLDRRERALRRQQDLDALDDAAEHVLSVVIPLCREGLLEETSARFLIDNDGHYDLKSIVPLLADRYVA